MPSSFDRIIVPRRRGWIRQSRFWREWCFLRLVVWRYTPRLGLLVLVLLGGAALFTVFEPEKRHTPAEAAYLTWALVFGEAAEAFPRSPVLRALFFFMPVFGLTVIIEGILDFALMLRDRRRHERSWYLMMASTFHDHIVLVGVGRLGYRVFSLLRRMGEPVVVVERDADNPFLDDVRRDGSPLLIGDARREALLVDANVSRARSVVLATNDDLANLEIALDARRLAPQVRVVLRMFDQNMADKIRDGFKIHVALSQSATAAPAFAMAALDSTILNSFVVNDELVVMVRWTVDAGGPLCDQTIAEVMTQWQAGVVRFQPRGGAAAFFPAPDTRLSAGDELIVQARFETLCELRRRLPGGPGQGARTHVAAQAE